MHGLRNLNTSGVENAALCKKANWLKQATDVIQMLSATELAGITRLMNTRTAILDDKGKLLATHAERVAERERVNGQPNGYKPYTTAEMDAEKRRDAVLHPDREVAKQRARELAA